MLAGPQLDRLNSYDIIRRSMVTIILVLAILLTSGSLSAARQARAPTPCVPRHSRFIAADAQARLYEVTAQQGPLEHEGIYDCFYGNRRPYLLGFTPPLYSAGGTGGVIHEVLAGPVTAYEEFKIGTYEKGEWRVIVRDLRNGRVLHNVPTGPPSEVGPEKMGVGGITTIVVKKDGAAVWILDNYGRPSGPVPSDVQYYEVESVDKSGLRILASGTDIDPSSLALAGSVLYWVQGGQAFSALLQ